MDEEQIEYELTQSRILDSFWSKVIDFALDTASQALKSSDAILGCESPNHANLQNVHSFIQICFFLTPFVTFIHSFELRAFWLEIVS